MDGKLTIMLEGFENISENEKFVSGGFSKSYTFQVRETSVGYATDNCHGGNCVAGCGGNNGCNTVAGCGTIKK